MSMQVTQSLGFDAGDKKHGGLNSEHPEHTYLNMATTFLFHTSLLPLPALPLFLYPLHTHLS